MYTYIHTYIYLNKATWPIAQQTHTEDRQTNRTLASCLMYNYMNDVVAVKCVKICHWNYN